MERSHRRVWVTASSGVLRSTTFRCVPRPNWQGFKISSCRIPGRRSNTTARRSRVTGRSGGGRPLRERPVGPWNSGPAAQAMSGVRRVCISTREAPRGALDWADPTRQQNSVVEVRGYGPLTPGRDFTDRTPTLPASGCDGVKDEGRGSAGKIVRPPLFNYSDRIRTREPGRLRPVPHRRGRGGHCCFGFLPQGPPVSVRTIVRLKGV